MFLPLERQAGMKRPSKSVPVSVPVSVPAPTIKACGISNANGSQYVIKGARRTRNPLQVSTSAPAPALAACGIGDGNCSQYRIAVNGQSDGTGKPQYRVPSMAEIVAVKPAGLVAADLFSGCGGSCLGFRMAGFRVVWANEFVAHAQECHEANFKDCHLDKRDVRQVQPHEILKVLGLKKGQLDLLSGSPPCQSFSTAGQREKGWGKEREYEHGAKQRNEDLFQEYIRLLRGMMPKVMVAENVSGLAKGVAKGFFLGILADMKASGYVVECRLLDAQWLGVPQQRQRLIFIGIRADLSKLFKIGPAFPAPLSYRYSVADACPWIGTVQTREHGFTKTNTLALSVPAPAPAPAVPASGGSSYDGHQVSVKIEGANGFNGRQISRPLPTVQAGRPVNLLPSELQLDKSRQSLCDGRKKFGANGAARPGEPCPTVQTIAHDTVLVTERRKFTIAELKRICAFSDDFVLVGTYSQQWARLGNAVPPLMMKAVAETLKSRVFAKINEKRSEKVLDQSVKGK